MNKYERQELITDLCEKYTQRQLAAMYLDMEDKMDLLDSILPVSIDEMLEGLEDD